MHLPGTGGPRTADGEDLEVSGNVAQHHRHSMGDGPSTVKGRPSSRDGWTKTRALAKSALSSSP